MVGVPGRSKGCNTCKQRKISCSLEKPECRTCLKSKRICTGYQRERIFLFDQHTACDGQKAYRKPTEHSVSVVAARKRKAKPLAFAEVTPLMEPVSDKLPSGVLVKSSLVGLTSVSLGAAYRRQILGDLLYHTIPDSYHLKADPEDEMQSSTWLAMLPTLPDMTTALETAIMATAVARFGRIKKDPALIHESLKFYTKGLVDLQKALWNPELMYRDETAAACMALLMYEFTECPGESIAGWQSHIRACAKLFELKGPEAFTSDFGHQLFLSFRLMEIQLALSERRPTYLASPAWQAKPWRNRVKTTFHQFLNIMALLPNIIADGYRLIEPLVTSKNVDLASTLTGVSELLVRSWELDRELQAFHTRLEQTNLGPVYWPKLAQVTELDGEQQVSAVFPVEFHFANLQMAHLCMLYWATLCILHTGINYSTTLLTTFDHVHVHARDPSQPTTSAPPTPTALSRSICQSLAFCTLPTHRSFGSTICIFPLKIAIEAFHDAGAGCAPDEEWAVRAMAVLGGGVRIMRFLGSDWREHAYLPG